MDSFVYNSITTIGYGGIALLMIIFPAETVMVIAGYVAGTSQLSLALVIAAGAVGSTVGSTIVYIIARSIDKPQLYDWADRYGRFVGLRRHNIQRAGSWFNMHAKTAVLFGRFLPTIRTAVSIPAGFERMPLVVFLVFTALGSGLDAAALSSLGYFASSHIDNLLHDLSVASNIVTVIGVLAIAWLIYRHGRARTHD